MQSMTEEEIILNRFNLERESLDLLKLCYFQEDDLLELQDIFSKYSPDKQHILVHTIVNKITSCPTNLLDKLFGPYKSNEMEWNQFLQFVLIICTMTFRDLATLAIASLEHVVPYAISFEDVEKVVNVLGINFIPDNAYLVYMLEHYDQNDDKHLTLSEYLCFAEEQQYLYRYLLSFQTQLQKFTLSTSKWEDVIYRKNNIEIILKYESVNGKNIYPKLSCNEKFYRYFEGLKHPYYYNFSYLSNNKDNTNLKPSTANKRFQQLLIQFYSLYDPSFRKRVYHNVGNQYSESRLNSVSSTTSTYPPSKSIQSSTSLVIFNTPKTTINNANNNNNNNTPVKSRLSSVTSLSQRRVVNNLNLPTNIYNNNSNNYNIVGGGVGVYSTIPPDNNNNNTNNLPINRSNYHTHNNSNSNNNNSHHSHIVHTISADESYDTLMSCNSQRERHVNSAVVIDHYNSSNNAASTRNEYKNSSLFVGSVSPRQIGNDNGELDV